MKISSEGRDVLVALEGVVTRAYRDPAGVWTIGVGHTASAGPPPVHAGLAISRAEALRILDRDLERFEARVAAALGPVPQAVFDGAVSFDFNTGAIDRASWVRAWRAGDRQAAEAGLLQWVKAGGRTLPGLVRRRTIEADMILRGRYPAADDPLSGAEATREVQEALIALGLYAGPVDGISGPATRAAISAFQRRHPDLVVDGIAGPATRSALARERDARASFPAAAGAAGVTVAGTALAARTDQASLALTLGALACLAACVVGVAAWRYRHELGRIARRLKETL